MLYGFQLVLRFLIWDCQHSYKNLDYQHKIFCYCRKERMKYDQFTNSNDGNKIKSYISLLFFVGDECDVFELISLQLFCHFSHEYAISHQGNGWLLISIFRKQWWKILRNFEISGKCWSTFGTIGKRKGAVENISSGFPNGKCCFETDEFASIFNGIWQSIREPLNSILIIINIYLLNVIN